MFMSRKFVEIINTVNSFRPTSNILKKKVCIIKLISIKLCSFFFLFFFLSFFFCLFRAAPEAYMEVPKLGVKPEL